MPSKKPPSPSTDSEVDELGPDISAATVNSDVEAEPSFTRSPSSETIATASARSNETDGERKASPSNAGSEEEDELEDDEDDDGDSRDAEDDYSGVESEDSLDASFADDSFVPDSDGSEYDQLEGSGSSSDDIEEEEGEAEDEDQSVDLEWEEAQEMAGMAIRSHRSALKAAAIDGWLVGQDKTVLGTVEVVRSLVNTVGAFEDGPVTADIILTYLATHKTFLLSKNGEFLFENRRDLINKYLALVKYASNLSIDPTIISKVLKEILAEDVVHDVNGNIDLKMLVRLMKQRSTEAQ